MEELNDFSAIADSLYNYIKKHWTGSIKPKKYKEFLEDYEDYAGMEELNTKELEESFKGFIDSTAASFSFPVKTSLPHVAYDDTNQGRCPLRVLISACLSHGLIIGEQRGKLKAAKAVGQFEANHKFGIDMLKLELSMVQ